MKEKDFPEDRADPGEVLFLMLGCSVAMENRPWSRIILYWIMVDDDHLPLPLERR